MFKVTHFDPRTLRWWYAQRTKIDMAPPYQRKGRLWSTTDKAFLVDSVLNEYDVPKIYMADFNFGPSKLNHKGLPYAIIDGKQRLEALFDFFAGNLVLDEDFVLQSDPSLKLGGLGYPDLRKQYPDIADTFENFPLSVMRVITDDETKINDLFVRLNRSKPLTGAEIRNAMSGPVPSLVRLLSEHDIFTQYIRFSTSRGEDRNAAAKLLLFEMLGRPSETKKRNLDEFTQQSSNTQQTELELAGRRVVDTLNRMASIFLPHDQLLSSAGIIPVYYWFIRQRRPDDDQFLREFLVDFERRRKENRASSSAATSLRPQDPQLVAFDNLNRNTNDLASHDGRLDILNQEFGKSKAAKRSR